MQGKLPSVDSNIKGGSSSFLSSLFFLIISWQRSSFESLLIQRCFDLGDAATGGYISTLWQYPDIHSLPSFLILPHGETSEIAWKRNVICLCLLADWLVYPETSLQAVTVSGKSQGIFFFLLFDSVWCVHVRFFLFWAWSRTTNDLSLSCSVMSQPMVCSEIVSRE